MKRRDPFAPRALLAAAGVVAACALWAPAVGAGGRDGGTPPAAYDPTVFMLVPSEPRPGDIVRVTINLAPPARGGVVIFDGRRFPGFVTGGLLNAFIGVDLDVAPGLHALAWELGDGGELKGGREITIHPREFAVERLTVDSKYTALDEASQARADREAAQLEEIWSTITPERLWAKAFVRPAAGALGSPFGLRRYFNDEPRSPHAGLDVKAPQGAEVFATNAGRVALARDLFFTGNTVVLDHGMGLYTIYAHLSRIDVAEGAAVERSQRIGLVGATGRATGPHLHWGVRLGGARVDPSLLPGLVL
jgi:hypothetical protein